MKKIKNFILLLLTLLYFCTGCTVNISDSSDAITEINIDNSKIDSEVFVVEPSNWFDSIPEYRGTPYIEVNRDIPFFTAEDKQKTDAFEIYSDLDELGRCNVAYANICEEIMPTEKREESISSVTPSG